MHLKKLGNLQNATTVITNTFDSVKKVTGRNFNDVVNNLKEGLKNYSLECVKLASNQMNLTKLQAKAIFTAKGLKGAELEQAIATATLSASESTAAGTTLGLGTAFQGLKFKIKETAIAMGEFLLANPFGWVVLGVASIASITFQIVQFQKKLEEHRQKIKEAGETARSEIDSLKSDLDNLTSSADKALAAYAKLMDGISTFNNTNLSLSDEEYAEFISASNELADLFPELVIGLDKEGNRILDLGTNAEKASDKIKSTV